MYNVLMSKYQEIYLDIRSDILSGTYPEHQKMPGEEELAEKYGVSRVTIAKAFRLLRENGCIVTRRGHGTYACQPKEAPFRDIAAFTGTSARLYDKEKVDTQIIAFHVRFADEDEAEKLQIDTADVIYDIIRLRIVDKEPYALEYTLMPVNVIPHVTEDVLKHSIYRHIENTLHLKIGKAKRRIKADKSDAYDQKYLRCAEDDPVLEVEQTVRLADGRIFEYSQSRFRYDKAVITSSG